MKPLILPLFCALFLTGCQLQVASTSAPVTTPPAATLPIASTPLSVATNTQTPASVPVTDVRTILERSANAMVAISSYEYRAVATTNYGGEDETTSTTAVIFPRQGDGRIETTQGGSVGTTWLKDHRMYMIDPESKQWVYLQLDPPEERPVVIHQRVSELMTLSRDGQDLVLTSVRPLNALEFYSLTGIEEQEQATLETMASLGQTMETMVTFILDEAYRYKTVLYEQVVTTSGVSTFTASSYEYSAYDQAPPVEVPREILSGAIPLDPSAGD